MRKSDSLTVLSALLAHDSDASQLNAQHLQILGVITGNGRSVTPAEIATALRISLPHVSRMTKTMAAHGLISKSRRNDDERHVDIEPTPKGRELDARVRGYIATAFPKGENTKRTPR